jgi:Leucine-rich repeat (LRR) protein
VQQNKLKKLPPHIFKDLVALTVLYLGSNEIEKVEVNSFVGLEKLELFSLCFNKLEYLPPNFFGNFLLLKEIRLCGNSIKELDENLFGGLRNLMELNLIGNQFKILSEKLFDDLTSLRGLFLEDSPFESLSVNLFSKLINLKELGFRNAFFDTVPDKLFKNNVNLIKLKLGGKITKMSNKMFSHLRKLKTLDLLDNHCISMEIKDHNSSIAFTEEILVSCSCNSLKEGKSNSYIKGLFISVGVIAAIVLFILALALIKMVMQKDFQSRETFLVFKNGNYFQQFLTK